MRAPRISIVLIAVTCLVGCAAPHAHSSVDYDVEFVSKRTDSVDEVQAKLGDSRAAVGIMPPGKHAILALFNEPFSSDAVLYWKKETDGSHWRASVGSLEWSKIAIRDREGGRLGRAKGVML